MSEKMSSKEIQKQKDWICERIQTSHTGRIIIKEYLIKNIEK